MLSAGFEPAIPAIVLLQTYWRKCPTWSESSCWRSPRNDTSSCLWRQTQENAALL